MGIEVEGVGPHNAEMNKGSIWEIDESFCVHAKETLSWLIWDLYEQRNKH